MDPTDTDDTGNAVYVTYSFPTTDMINKFACTLSSATTAMDKYSCNFAMSMKQLATNGGNEIVRLTLTFEAYVIKATGASVTLSSKPMFYGLGTQGIVNNVVPDMFISDNTYVNKDTRVVFTYNDLIYLKFSIKNPDLAKIYKVTFGKAVLNCNNIPVGLTPYDKQELLGELKISVRLINTGTPCNITLDAQMVLSSRRLLKVSRVLQTNPSTQIASGGLETTFTLNYGGLLQIALAFLCLIFFLI